MVDVQSRIKDLDTELEDFPISTDLGEEKLPLRKGLHLIYKREEDGDRHRLKVSLHQWDAHLLRDSVLFVRDVTGKIYDYLIIGVKDIVQGTIKAVFKNLPVDRELVLCITK